MRRGQASSQGPQEAAEAQFGALKAMLMHLIKLESDWVGWGGLGGMMGSSGGEA